VRSASRWYGRSLRLLVVTSRDQGPFLATFLPQKVKQTYSPEGLRNHIRSSAGLIAWTQLQQAESSAHSLKAGQARHQRWEASVELIAGKEEGPASVHPTTGRHGSARLGKTASALVTTAAPLTRSKWKNSETPMKQRKTTTGTQTCMLCRSLVVLRRPHSRHCP
jgi:hypothetical protein